MRYAELHCKSNFSFLEGASHPDELVERAAELGYAAIAITDRESVAGIVRGFTPAKERGIQYIVGAELHPIDGPTIVVWPTDRAAYGRMCRLISRGRLRAEKGQCELRMADIAEFSAGLIAAVVPDVDDIVDPQSGRHRRLSRFLRTTFRDTFGDRSHVLCELHRGVDDSETIARLRRLCVSCDVPMVAGGGVHYHSPDRMILHDTLSAIRRGVTVETIAAETQSDLDGTPSRFANSQHCLRTIDEIQHLFRDAPDAIARTIEIADQCTFTLDELRYEYPAEIAPSGMTLIEHLKRLTWEGAKQRWPDQVPTRVIDQLRHEMRLIEDLNYEAYFLTVWDIVRFARSRGILCQGRGSAANSAVCYCLGVTNVDPSQTDLLFERFVSRERDEAPDIDVDFEHQRREEVIQYIYEKYGRDRAGMTAVVTTYRTRSAIREVGKALGVSADVIDTIAKLGSDGGEFVQRCVAGGMDIESDIGKRFVYLVTTLVGFPRHLSQHTGGMVMTAGHLCELCPVENASMPGRTVIQWNKDDLDELGILKVDVLALGMLSAIRRCLEMVHHHHGNDLTLANIPPDDGPTYDMICAAETTGVFQIESRAQMSMLPRLRPRCYYDLVVEVAIVRPGPIQGNMVHPYLKARENPASVVYPNDAIRGVLEKTLGVPIFQEQAMRLAVVAAGFTPGEADQLRRAMAAWRRPGVIDEFRLKLLNGMAANGLTGEFAEHVFHQIRGFGEYGFPESHAASFALLVYASCYLKRHYPAAFCASLLNSQPMGFYAPAQLIADAAKNGVRVMAVDVNHSDWDSTLHPDPNRFGPAIRLGLRTIMGLAEHAARAIVDDRVRGGDFASIDDLVRRAGVGKGLLKTLADADALASLAGNRRAAVWQSLAQEKTPGGTPLFDTIDDDDLMPDELLPMTPEEEVYADYQTTGLSLKAHPISFSRDNLKAAGCVRAVDLPALRDGRHVRVAGLVLMRQQPSTAKGIVFITIEDETGSVNLVLFPKVWERFYLVAKTSNAWIVDGKLENRSGVIHVIVGRVADLNDEVDFGGQSEQRLTPRSRDFR